MSGAIDIEAAVALAEAQTGTHKPGHSRIPLVAAQPKRGRYWTKEEERILQENLGKTTIQEIARKLGRSWSAVVNHYKREMHLSGATRDPRILTGEHVAMGLCIDGHSVARILNRRLIPWRLLVVGRKGERPIRVVDRLVMLNWILEPAHWCFFKPARVGAMVYRGKRGYTGVYDEAFWDGARKLVRAKARKWKDRWLTPTQAARILGLKGRAGGHNLNKAIHRGTLKATRWGNWWILRSDLPKEGTFDATGKWVPKILTRSELGQRNFRKFWEDVHAGRRPWFSNGGHNKKVKERQRFFQLLGKDQDVRHAAAAVGVSNPTAYKWLKEKHGKGWQQRYAFTRESRKARFFKLFKGGSTVKQAADAAGVHVESCYKWLHYKVREARKKALRARRRAA